ncbi:hypothetical protein [Streptomyces sp. NPDC020681]|uniref:hypothetical protein n=1 Tax=Streptomyces sp. NPDC020681 TaxID=3365083 RepID=UPI00379CC50F
MKRRFVVVGVALAVMTVMAGCTSGNTQGKPDNAPVSAGRLKPLTDAEQLRISDAQQQLITTCMARQGFAYFEAQKLSLEESRTLGYVSDDIAWARKHGYGSRIRAKEDRVRRSNPNIAYRKSLPEERRKAWDRALDDALDAPVMVADVPGGGTYRKQVGGCVAESERKLYGDPKAWFQAEKTSGSLRPMYVPKVLADRQFAAALNAWAQCMKRAGHPYKDPGEARQAAMTRAGQSSTDESFAAERKLAVADATCARDTELRSIGNERETHYVNRLRPQYGEALDAYARMQHQALARAVELVAPRT